MDKFAYMEKYDFEQLCFFQDKHTGLKAIVCVHDTVLGPGLGGTRIWNYDNEEDAVLDVLRLARGMTYKNAMAGLPLGGGKAVIIGDAKELRRDSVRSEAFWRAFGRFVEGLNGRYITAMDVGTTVQDMAYINAETNNVVGLDGRSGDPSPFTALGVFRSLLACAKHVYGSEDITGKKVMVQGMGSVGMGLCRHLHEAGAKLLVSDIDEEKIAQAVAEFGATKVGIDDVYSAEYDIYAPCALGGTIDDVTIPQLKCKIVCGGANNVLKDPQEHGRALNERGIVYAPDYVANAGGVINVAHERREGGYNKVAATRDVERIYWRILEILRTSEETGRLTHEVADDMAEARISAMRRTMCISTGSK